MSQENLHPLISGFCAALKLTTPTERVESHPLNPIILRIKFAMATTDCVAIGERPVSHQLDLDDAYFTAPINHGKIDIRSDGLYWKCDYSPERLSKLMSGGKDVEIAQGENWVDRDPKFGVLGREYKYVAIFADYDDVRKIITHILPKKGPSVVSMTNNGIISNGNVTMSGCSSMAVSNHERSNWIALLKKPWAWLLMILIICALVYIFRDGLLFAHKETTGETWIESKNDD